MKRSVGIVFGAPVVALMSYGSGCTSRPGSATAADAGAYGATDGSLTDHEPVGDDGGGDGYYVSPGDDCPNTAPTKADLDQIDGAPGWNPPSARQTSGCSAADLQKLGANLADHDLRTLEAWDDLLQGLPTSCAQCVLSREADPNWQIIVTDATGKNGFLNWGACYAVAPHGSQACGEANAYLHLCFDVTCDSCSTSGDYASCIGSKAVTNACLSEFEPMVQAGCEQPYAQELDEQCGQILDAAAIVCGDGTLPDGGKLTD